LAPGWWRIDHWLHVLCAGTVVWWLHHVLRDRLPLTVIMLLAAALGMVDESAQGISGVRSAEWGDFISDVIGIGLVGSLLAGLRYRRQRRRARSGTGAIARAAER
jgi:VanZ family protein